MSMIKSGLKGIPVFFISDVLLMVALLWLARSVICKLCGVSTMECFKEDFCCLSHLVEHGV